MRIAVLVDLGAVAENVAVLKKRIGESKFMLIVKADAYGHGAQAVARFVQDEVDYFGVAEIEEGLALKNAGVKKPVLVLGAPCGGSEKAIRAGLSLSVSDLRSAYLYESEAAASGLRARVHVACDTGMNRFGFKSVAEALEVKKLPHLDIEGVYSHFHDGDPEIMRGQYARFRPFKDAFSGAAHIAASGGLDRYGCDMARSGIAAYGFGEGLFPAMSVTARILGLKRVKKGEYIGYGKNPAERDMTLAVVSGGYADGLDRRLSGGVVRVNGEKCAVVGNVCMDCFFADVTGVDAKIGDIVAVMDTGDLNAEAIAERLGTIPYEVLTNFKGRTKRTYFT